MRGTNFRAALSLLSILFTVLAGPAFAGVKVIIDKSDQYMAVYEDGDHIYSWPVSTGRRLSWTPNGTFRVQWLHAHHYSSIYDNAPMPWSVFFNGNIAIHGTYATRQLGQPASHGCVRLSVENARTLYRLVQNVGKRNVTIVVRS